MQKQLIPFAKALGSAGLLSVSLSACVGGGTGSSSETTASSETAMSSEMSSVMESSSSMAPSSSSVASSSSVMSSSSMAVSSSSEAGLDCSTVNTSVGENIYKADTSGGLTCTTCHGEFDNNLGIFNGNVRKINPNSFTVPLAQSDLEAYIAGNMAAGKDKACTDAACEDRATELAKYILSKSNDSEWCASFVDAPSSSSAPMSSSSEASSSSEVAVSDDFVVLYAVNSGGDGFMSADGINFTSDFYVTSGSPGSTAHNIDNTDDPVLYQAERWGADFTYSFPVKPGNYDIELHMIEAYHGPQDAAGNRVFDVTVEGAVLVNDFDPLAVAGHDVAHIVELKNIAVSDDALDINFKAVNAESANVAGIVVRGLDGNKGEAPVVTGTVGTAPLPSDCSGDGVVGQNDFVLFDGSQVPTVMGSGFGRTLALHGGWTLQEVWDNGATLAAEDAVDGKSISYSNAGQFTGFKFAPPSGLSGVKAFSFDSIELFIDYETSKPANNLPKFGVRLNYAGEAAPDSPNNDGTRIWLVNENNQEPYSTQSKSCSQLSIMAPQGHNWSDPAKLGTKLILETKAWDNSDKLNIRRIVFKNFQYAN